MFGRFDPSVIVWMPVPGMLNAIMSAPGFALASRIACRREPGPLSLVLVTGNVIPAAALAAPAMQRTSVREGGETMRMHPPPSADRDRRIPPGSGVHAPGLENRAEHIPE